MYDFTPLTLEDGARMGALAAELVHNRLVARQRMVALLPTGSTPLSMYEHLRRLHGTGGAPSDGLLAFQLDEYVGLDCEDPRSYRQFMRRELGGLRGVQLHGPDAWHSDLEQAGRDYEQRLRQLGGVDLAVLGIGVNGHVAFNEPPADVLSLTRPVPLAGSTRERAAADFGSLAATPTQALTVGLGTIMAAKEVLLLASGAAKAPALRRMLREEPGDDSPASWLQLHPRLTVLCDRQAGRLL